MITIFTPVYNRAYCINRLYDSLVAQTYKDFEWIIIDDGSTDNIADVVNRYIEEDWIKILFFSQKNGGKHTAINNGISKASGDLFYIVDSDDVLPEDAVEFIVAEGGQIIDDDRFAGLAGCDRTLDGRILSNIPDGFVDSNPIDIRYKYDICGDMAEIFKTKVLKEFPFPVFEGERFCPEALVWNRIAAMYQLRYFSKVLKIVEYLPDGLTAKIAKLRHRSPVASTMYYSEFTRLDVHFVQKVKGAINFWRFFEPQSCRLIKPLNPFLNFVGFVPGKLMRLIDKCNGRF